MSDRDSKLRVLAIFDNDGTICDTQEVEGRCYSGAIEAVIGKSLAIVDWTKYVDPTSTSIVRDLLAADPQAEEREWQIKDEFLRRLRAEQPKWPGDFQPLAGALEFIERLRRERLCSVAIATGCFDISARFKLRCCGIELDDFPHATSSDTPRRREIIPLAAKRAGFELSSVVYFGDAPWDVRVCQTLGIPMIGIGRRHEALRSLGLANTFRDYSEPDRILSALKELAAMMIINAP